MACLLFLTAFDSVGCRDSELKLNDKIRFGFIVRGFLSPSQIRAQGVSRRRAPERLRAIQNFLFWI